VQYKTLSPDITVKADNDRGELTAAVVSYGIKDADGDIILPDSIADGTPVVVGAFGHTVWQGGQGGTPLGAGHLEVTPKHAVLHAQMWIDEIPEARSVFAAVKNLGRKNMAQFSIGFTTEDSGPGEYKGVRANLLRAITPIEVSPVLRGAQPGTHLIDAKSHCQCGCHTSALPPDLAHEMRMIHGELIRREWVEREKLKALRVRMIAEDFQVEQARRSLVEFGERWL
jgi:hypothetical protein